jgi:hypothetical protein
MPTKQILFALLACAIFATSQPLSVSIPEEGLLNNDCKGKAAGADCTLLDAAGLTVSGTCQDVLVFRTRRQIASRSSAS